MDFDAAHANFEWYSVWNWKSLIGRLAVTLVGGTLFNEGGINRTGAFINVD